MPSLDYMQSLTDHHFTPGGDGSRGGDDGDSLQYFVETVVSNAGRFSRDGRCTAGELVEGLRLRLAAHPSRGRQTMTALLIGASLLDPNEQLNLRDPATVQRILQPLCGPDQCIDNPSLTAFIARQRGQDRVTDRSSDNAVSSTLHPAPEESARDYWARVSASGRVATAEERGSFRRLRLEELRQSLSDGANDDEYLAVMNLASAVRTDTAENLAVRNEFADVFAVLGNHRIFVTAADGDPKSPSGAGTNGPGGPTRA